MKTTIASIVDRPHGTSLHGPQQSQLHASEEIGADACEQGAHARDDGRAHERAGLAQHGAAAGSAAIVRAQNRLHRARQPLRRPAHPVSSTRLTLFLSNPAFDP